MDTPISPGSPRGARGEGTRLVVKGRVDGDEEAAPAVRVGELVCESVCAHPVPSLARTTHTAEAAASDEESERGAVVELALLCPSVSRLGAHGSKDLLAVAGQSCLGHPDSNEPARAAMSSLTLALPASSLPTAHRPVQRVHAHPAVLASVLDAHLRRNTQQDRVFGTLLGVRDVQAGTVELRNAFGVPYEVRGKGQVTIDMDHHRAMLDLHLKVNPREVVVGWCVRPSSLSSIDS